MPIVAAKCPNCGGELQLDDSLKTGFCVYCGSRMIIQEAIELKKVLVEGRVSVDGIATAENLIIRGWQNVDDGNYDEALRYFDKAIDVDARSHAAWWGKFSAAYRSAVENRSGYNAYSLGGEMFIGNAPVTQAALERSGLTLKQFRKHRFDIGLIPYLSGEFFAIGQRAIEYAPEPQKARYAAEYENVKRAYSAMMAWAEDTIKKRVTYSKIKGRAIWTVIVGGIFTIDALAYFSEGTPLALLLLVIGVPFLILAIVSFSKMARLKSRDNMPAPYMLAYRG